MKHSEAVLYQHLDRVESLDYLAVQRFDTTQVLEIVPTALGRSIVSWALDYYFQASRKQAPSREMLVETWADQLEAAELDWPSSAVDLEIDSIESAVAALRGQYANWRIQQFVTDLARRSSKAPPPDKPRVVAEGAERLYRIAQTLTDRRQETLAGDGLAGALNRYEHDQAAGRVVHGLTFGWPEIDGHTLGIRPGELAVLAAHTGVGKSWVAAHTAVHEWTQGRRAVLYTLENDLDMTHDRLACIYARADYRSWQRREAAPDVLERVRVAQREMAASDNQPVIIMTQPGEATPASLIRRALVRDADSVIIDQLSHVEYSQRSARMSPWEVTLGKMGELHHAVKDATPLPCLVLHQTSREGWEHAQKTGHYEMKGLADGSAVEKYADFVFAVHQSKDARTLQEAELQQLKGRRMDIQDWHMWWRLGLGDIRVQHAIVREASHV